MKDIFCNYCRRFELCQAWCRDFILYILEYYFIYNLIHIASTKFSNNNNHNDNITTKTFSYTHTHFHSFLLVTSLVTLTGNYSHLKK